MHYNYQNPHLLFHGKRVNLLSVEVEHPKGGIVRKELRAKLARKGKKTGKLLIAHEAPRNCGFGAEIATRISEEAFEYLDAPIRRLCSFDSPVPYSKSLENEVLPQPADLESALRALANY